MALEDEVRGLARVFVPHPIDPALTFSEWGGTHVDARAFREGVRGRTWPELEGSFLEHHHDALVFFGPSSMPEFLPAYLAALVRRDPALSALPGFLLGILTREQADDRFDDLYGQLSTAQRRTVARVLVAYERELEGSSRQADVTRALDSYWRGQTGAA
jgi:hypothetical protein